LSGRILDLADFMPGSILAFAIASIVIEITPGPNMAYLAALTVSNGIRAGVAAVAGVALGLAIYGAVAAVGLAEIIQQSRFLYEALRWSGVAFLLWLAWEGWFAEPEAGPDATDGHDGTLRKAFQRGLITNLLNPKAGIFFIAVVPTFVTPATDHVMAQTLVLSAVYVTVATSIHLLIVLLASRLRDVLSDPTRRRTIRKVLAVVLAAIAVWFAVTTTR
jgi:threonine/homoserine/homoserine lactone efflux protein